MKSKDGRPSFTTATGYTLKYRTLSPETIPRLEAAARLALAEAKPTIPTQRVPSGPDEWKEVENPHDEQYQEAMEGWAALVEEEQGRRFLTLCEEYALIYEVDAEEVAAFKSVCALTGDASIADMTDKQVFLWKIVFPTPDDLILLYGKLFGGLTEEAIQAQKASFLGQLQGALDTGSARPAAA